MTQGTNKTTTALPKRRTDRLSVQSIGNETLLYDEDTHKAYLLNPVAAAVWNACDGASTVEQIARAATHTLAWPVSEDLVHFTLDELRRDHMLQSEEALHALPLLERRELLRKIGKAAVISLPIIAMIVAPTAAQAYAGGVQSTNRPVPVGDLAPSQRTHTS